MLQFWHKQLIFDQSRVVILPAPKNFMRAHGSTGCSITFPPGVDAVTETYSYRCDTPSESPLKDESNELLKVKFRLKMAGKSVIPSNNVKSIELCASRFESLAMLALRSLIETGSLTNCVDQLISWKIIGIKVLKNVSLSLEKATLSNWLKKVETSSLSRATHLVWRLFVRRVDNIQIIE